MPSRERRCLEGRVRYGAMVLADDKLRTRNAGEIGLTTAEVVSG